MSHDQNKAREKKLVWERSTDNKQNELATSTTNFYVLNNFATVEKKLLIWLEKQFLLDWFLLRKITIFNNWLIARASTKIKFDKCKKRLLDTNL